MPEPDHSDLRGTFDEWKTNAEKSVRDEPFKAAGLAVAAGMLLSILPVGRVIGGLVRLAFLLLKPALLIFGVIKLIEQCDTCRNAASKVVEEAEDHP